MEFSRSIAVHYKIDTYFCGLEPAENKETRLFTNERLGPLSLKA